jgi:hypothetical protein
MFTLEAPGAGGEEGFLDTLGGEDRRLCMSGRCALYYCLLDLAPRDATRIAYLPAYTCETVIAPYKKAGYTPVFYDLAPEGLTPQFDPALIPRISVLGLCGYYGFSSYSRDFVGDCVKAGVTVLQDITHSAFSAGGIEPQADYIAGSLRKWMGIPSGGIAVKRRGGFSPALLAPEEEHIRGRLACFEEQARVERGEAGTREERPGEIFWETEMRLRRIFDAYESDGLSRDIMTRFPWKELIRRRRANYARILEHSPFGPGALPVFPRLEEGVCPSHFPLYSPNREEARALLAAGGVKSTVYWPFHGELDLADFPGARYIYDHIYTIPVDQRYTPEDMDTIARSVNR